MEPVRFAVGLLGLPQLFSSGHKATAYSREYKSPVLQYQLRTQNLHYRLKALKETVKKHDIGSCFDEIILIEEQLGDINKLQDRYKIKPLPGILQPSLETSFTLLLKSRTGVLKHHSRDVERRATIFAKASWWFYGEPKQKYLVESVETLIGVLDSLVEAEVR